MQLAAWIEHEESAYMNKKASVVDSYVEGMMKRRQSERSSSQERESKRNWSRPVAFSRGLE